MFDKLCVDLIKSGKKKEKCNIVTPAKDEAHSIWNFAGNRGAFSPVSHKHGFVTFKVVSLSFFYCVNRR